MTKNAAPIILLLLGIWFFIIMSNIFQRNYLDFHFRMIKAKQDQIIFMLSGDYDPVDLTYRLTLSKKEGSKEKE
jgi:hypothetical protein